MPDHVSDPFIVWPSTQARDRSYWTNIGKKEDKTSSAARKGFIMWRNLFRTNSLEQSLHVVIVSIYKGIGLSVVGMNITTLHVCNTFLIVALSIGLFILWLDSEIQLYTCWFAISTYCFFWTLLRAAVRAMYAYSNLSRIETLALDIERA
jgi:hypothetical protein